MDKLKLLGVSSLALILVACGPEDRDYDEVERAPEEQKISDYDESQLWLYVPSTADAPRYAFNMDPFFQGREKIVRLNFEEGGLKVVEVDRDLNSADQESRWDDGAPVLTIPGIYQDYRCRKDKYDECTNEEEINNDSNVKWYDKPYFTPDFASLETNEVNTMDLWYNNSAVSESAQPEVVNWELDLEKGVVNVELKRTFTVNRSRIWSYYRESLSDLSFTTSFYYSIVKLDTIADPNYEPILYAQNEEDTFGFFTNDFNNLDSDYRKSDGSSRMYLNRFSPNKASIDYYLSDTFHKPENKLFLDSTIEAIDHINQAIQGSGVPPIRIMNPDQTANVQVGDLRYNVINLIDRPLANGLLGYGPSVGNPLTGEIVKAHVNQYSGVIRTVAPRVWNSLARHHNRGDFGTNPGLSGVAPVTAAMATGTETSSGNEISSGYGLTSEVALEQSHEEFKAEERGRKESITRNNEDFAYKTFEDPTLSDITEETKKRLARWAENNAHGEEAIWVSSTAKGLIRGINYDNAELYRDEARTKLKKWVEIDKELRKELSDAISVHIYRSTFVHEIGHNLGLRHNFAGSRDNANFYTEEQAKSLGIETVPSYSSIMDYAASEFDELPVFGPYDVAALRYAYARNIEVPYKATVSEADPNDPNVTVDTEVDKVALVNLSALDKAYYSGDDSVEYGPVAYVSNLLDNGSLDMDNPLIGATFNSQPEDFKTVLETGGLEPKYYDFCTDGNVSLNSNCNRFDEGETLVDIMLFRHQSYLDSYERRNTRDNRQDFWTGDIGAYTVRRNREFAEVRDFMEDFERIDDFIYSRYNENLTDYYEQCFTNNWWFCDYTKAAAASAEFLLSVVNAPDHMCEVADTNTLRDGTVYTEIKQYRLSDLYDQYDFYMPDGANTPKSCFDTVFAETLLNQENMVVLSETRDGRIVSTTKPNNPNHPFSNEIETIGTWVDKLLAVGYLVDRYSSRYTTEGGTMALVDLPGVKDRLLTSLDNMLNNKPQTDVVFVDANGNEVEPRQPYRWDNSWTLEDLPPYLGYIRRHFGLPMAGKEPTIRGMLEQVSQFGYSDNFYTEDKAKEMTDAVVLKEESYSDSDVVRIFERKGINYRISETNIFALQQTGALFLPDGSTVDEIVTEILESGDPAKSDLYDHIRAVFGKFFFPRIDYLGEEAIANIYNTIVRVEPGLITSVSDTKNTGASFEEALANLDVDADGNYSVSGGETATKEELLTLWDSLFAIQDNIIPSYWGVYANDMINASTTYRDLEPNFSDLERRAWQGNAEVLVSRAFTDVDLTTGIFNKIDMLPQR